MGLSITNTGNQSLLSGDELLIQQIDSLLQGARDPATVFPKFDELATELISYDRITIGVYVDGWSQIEIVYAAGAQLATYKTGDRHHIQTDAMKIWASKRPPLTNLTAESRPDQQLMQESDREAQEHGFKSWMLIPIFWNDEIKGDLLFRSFDDNTYQQREIDLAVTLAATTAEMIANAQIISEDRLEANIHKDLLELSRLVSAVQNLQDVESDFGNIILAIMNSDRASVSLPGSSGTFAENILVFGDPISQLGVVGKIPPLGSGKVSWLQAETAYVIDDKMTADSAINRWSQKNAENSGFHSALVAPVRWQGATIAALTYRSRRRNHFNDSYLDIANAIAHQVAGAIAGQVALQKTQEQSRTRDFLARIGRVITALQDFDETFDELAELITQLIPSERVSLITNQPETGLAIAHYGYGRELAVLSEGQIPNSGGQIYDVINRTRTPFVVDSSVPGIEQTLEKSRLNSEPVGLLSWMIAPLYWRDECIGSLHFRSEKPEAYTSSHTRLAAEITTQIAGIVAGSISYKELLKASKEREVLADISRAITSSQNLDESFTQLADSISQLIPWDRIAVTASNNSGDYDRKAFIYQAGIQYEGYDPKSAPFVMKGHNDVFGLYPSPIVVDEKMESEVAELRRGMSIARNVGLRSWLLAPIVWQNEQIGHIHLRSTKTDAYDESHIRLVARISDQISGAVAGIFANELLAKQVSERDALAEISRSITASEDIDETIGQFAQSVSRLIPWDRIAIVALSEPGATRDFIFQAGTALIGCQPNEIPFENKELFNTFADDQTPIIVGEDLITKFDSYREAYEISLNVGLNSWLLALLFWGSKQIGHLHFRSKQMNAYDESHVRLAAQISDQISGAIASHIAKIQMSKEAKIRNVLAELGRVIASSGDFGAALSEIERLSSEIIDFDGFSIGSYDAQRRTVRRIFARGLFKHDDDSNEVFPIDESAAHVAIKSAKPIRQVFSSLEQLRDFPKTQEVFEVGTRAFLTAPLISNDEIVGVMQYRSRSPQAFNEVEVDNSQRLADQIAGALANSLANEQIRLQATALESADNAIVITTSKGIIEWTNSAFSRLSGWTASEVVGQHTSIMKSADPKNWSEDVEIWNALDSGKSWSGTHINKKKDGSEYPEELTVTPVLDQDGDVTHIIGIKKDISERLLAEEAHDNSLRIESENRELQRLASARSEFLSTVSHELRTPLTTVSAFADILFNSKSENLTERQREHIELIRKSSTQLGSLIDDLLDISQADTGHLVLNKAVCNVSDMVDEVASNAKVLFAHRKQKFKVKNKAKKRGLLGDRSRVIQILTNLFTNASKFSDEGSTIGFQVEIKQEQIAFTVKDSGVGISKSDQAMMFSPFFRGTSESSVPPDGRGLGLAVVRSLVDLHDGSIVVDSESGEGTEITVTLPGVTKDVPKE